MTRSGEVFAMNPSKAPASARRRDIELWIGLFAGPLAWSLDLGLSYLLVWPARASGRTAAIHLVGAVALAITAAGAVASWIAWRRVGEAPRGVPEGRVRSRSRFMALAGLVSSAFFALVILAEAIPVFLLRPGD
jgi:hypothetical protein